jgi:hypothetical protein
VLVLTGSFTSVTLTRKTNQCVEQLGSRPSKVVRGVLEQGVQGCLGAGKGVQLKFRGAGKGVPLEQGRGCNFSSGEQGRGCRGAGKGVQLQFRGAGKGVPLEQGRGCNFSSAHAQT